MIDNKTIENIAKLARLKIEEAELTSYSQQLNKLMGYFEQIAKVPTENVEPLVTPSEIESFWRQDEVKSDFQAEEMVANAPQKTGNLFTVPPVV
jgi:aspartyl-tRNA(Asn)/glutamyl-tRNA(Gln) amidotransferase subunit C